MNFRYIHIFLLFIQIILNNQLCFSQDYEIFEIDDYLSPRIWKAYSFLNSRIIVGTDENFNYHNEFTNTRINFIHIVNNFYFDFRNQATFSVLTIQPSDLTKIFSFKCKLQYSTYNNKLFYFKQNDIDIPIAKIPSYTRHSLSVSFERKMDGTEEFEFGFAMDLSPIRLNENWDFPPLFGGLGFKVKQNGEFFLSIAYRYNILSIDRYGLKYGFAFSGNDIDIDKFQWRWHENMFRNEIFFQTQTILL